MVAVGYTFQTADIIGAAAINVIIFLTVVPLAYHTATILLQGSQQSYFYSWIFFVFVIVLYHLGVNFQLFNK